MDLDSWLERYRDSLGSRYELLFVEKVLSCVGGLDLSTVQAQYEFRDLDGKKRFCDFVLIEGPIQIAIEVDGYDKRNTGQGMTHDDFIDWQRRQAALTAAGWHVLRFANRDVRDNPRRCQRYIELLLNSQRSKSQHQTNLEASIRKMSAELKVAQSKRESIDRLNELNQEIALLKKQLALAKNTQPLSAAENVEKQQLVKRLEQENLSLKQARAETEKQKVQLSLEKKEIELQSQALGEGNNTMRTAIWAFTVIIGLLILSGVYFLVNSDKSIVIAGSQNNTSLAASKPTLRERCQNSIPWFEAKKMNGQFVTVLGAVVEHRYMPQVNGQPTWINIGGQYPNKNRLAIAVWGEDRPEFEPVLANDLTGRQVCVSGLVRMREGVPQLILRERGSLIAQ